MKKIFKILPLALLAISTVSAAIFVGNNNKNDAVEVAEAATYSGYKVKVNWKVTDDSDDWNGADIGVMVKPNNGRGDEYFKCWSGDFKNSVSYSGANYTSNEIDCGTEFPHKIVAWTDIGTWGQYHYGEADITVYINGINVASRHISYGGWSRNKDWNWVEISETKFPYPVQKKINIDYSENVDPADESTQLVKISATDQYGVKWTTPASSPITVLNESYPGEDTAERLDDFGFQWKLSTSKTIEHASNYYFYFSTGSSVYPTVEKKITVRFAFPLHLTIKIDGKVVYKTIGYEGDIIELPDLETPVGYYIKSYDKNKADMGKVTKDKETGKFTFKFISGDTTLTAKLNAISYKIHFDKNGENVNKTMNDKTVSYNSNATLPINYYVRENYKFLGWNTKADGTGTFFANKAKIPNLSSTAGEIVVLYAQWEPLNPSVTASLFTDGTFGLIVGGTVALASIIGLAVFFFRKKRIV